MSKQWMAVTAIIAGLVIGAVAITKFGPDTGIVETGASAPDYRLVDVASGDSVSLRQKYRGRVTMVNIWATWCPPCKQEMPSMQALYRDYEARGFRIAAVSIDEDANAGIKEFAASLGLTFDLLQDRSGGIQQVFQTTGVPESFLLDHRGVIVKRVMGAHDWNSPVNRALIDKLLAEAS